MSASVVRTFRSLWWTSWRWAGGLLLVAGMALSALAETPAQPEGASGFTPRPEVLAPQAMVVTANPYATDAALAVLREGGTAVDAAITAALVLNIVEPQSSGIGGGGFLVHFDAANTEVSAWDGRETAPKGVDEGLFLKADGDPMAFFDAVVGGRSVGVPGLLRMFEAAHARYGRLPWTRLFQPAIDLAAEGFAVSPRLHALLSQDRFLPHDGSARRLFYDDAGQALRTGTWLTNPELAEVLRLISERGADAFYTGEIAQDVVAAVAAQPAPGALALEDLAAYRAVRREPLCGRYREYRVCGMPPPSSGAGTVLSILGTLERFGIARIDPDSAFVTHLFSEAGRLAFADRDAWYGDPGAMQLDPEALIDPDYLRGRGAGLSLSTTIRQAEPGSPHPRLDSPVAARSAERPATTHISIVDAAGNAVSMTTSIESAFGSRRMVRGFLLNNQLTDFSFRPEGDRGPHPNRVGPGKRPRSSMAPTLVFDARGALFAVTGSPGGSQIINYVAASIVGLVDWRMQPARLMARPHAGSRNGPTEIEDTPEGGALAARLTAFGHEVVLRDLTSGLGIIVREEKGWRGAADPRREGTAAGY